MVEVEEAVDLLCVICQEEPITIRCDDGHGMCRPCGQMLAATCEPGNMLHGGGVPCPLAVLPEVLCPRVFSAEQIAGLFVDDPEELQRLRRYLHSTLIYHRVHDRDDGDDDHDDLARAMRVLERARLEDIVRMHVDNIINLLLIVCPSCHHLLDQRPDACRAMTCPHCRAFFCWVCFQVFESNQVCHRHVIDEHDDLFLPQPLVNVYHRTLHVLQIRNYIANNVPMALLEAVQVAAHPHLAAGPAGDVTAGLYAPEDHQQHQQQQGPWAFFMHGVRSMFVKGGRLITDEVIRKTPVEVLTEVQRTVFKEVQQVIRYKGVDNFFRRLGHSVLNSKIHYGSKVVTKVVPEVITEKMSTVVMQTETVLISKMVGAPFQAALSSAAGVAIVGVGGMAYDVFRSLRGRPPDNGLKNNLGIRARNMSKESLLASAGASIGVIAMPLVPTVGGVVGSMVGGVIASTFFSEKTT